MKQRPLESRYRIERFEGCEDVDQETVIRFWTEQANLPEGGARERVNEVMFVVLNEDNTLVGLCTVYLKRNQQLQGDFWHFRSFVRREDRQSNIAFHLTHHARDALRDNFISGQDKRAPGMIMEVENELLKKYRNEAVWESSQFAFFGSNERGDHCRVYFFPGARVPGLG
jgi:hypothetical protein